MSALVAFILGSCIGSFLNVVILRYLATLPDSELSFADLTRRMGGRSHCPRCQRQLRWWELVPIFSFIWLRGRCQSCREEISVQYPVVEFTMGLVTVLLATPLPSTPLALLVTVLHLTMAALLIILFVIDFKSMLLPDGFVGLLLLVVLGEQLLMILTTEYMIQNSLFGLAVGAGFLLFLWLVTRGKGIGLGDVKLMIPLGLYFGLLNTVALLGLAYLVGGAVALYLLFRQQATLKTALPFGPFLCAAALLLLILPGLSGKLLNLILGY